MYLDERNIELKELKDKIGQDDVKELLLYSLVHYQYEIIKIMEDYKEQMFKKIDMIEQSIKELKK